MTTINASIPVHVRPQNKVLFMLSCQHLFAMFGSNILVPYLLGFSPAMTLFGSGIGTLIFILMTRAKVPAYLGSSFVFIAPVMLIHAQVKDDTTVMLGFLATGILLFLVSRLVGWIGSERIVRFLPKIVIGPVIMIIGLELSPVAMNMATGYSDGQINTYATIIAAVTMITVIIFSVFVRGLGSLISVIIGIVVGYVVALCLGQVNLEKVWTAPILALPERFSVFQWDLSTARYDLLLIMLAPTFALMMEHIGHQLVLGVIVNKDLIRDPGLGASLGGDGLATMTSSLLGAPPVTTYGENMGVMAMNKVFSVWVIAGAAVLAISLSFIGKFIALMQSIPSSVMGGVAVLLFGTIAASGIQMLRDAKMSINNKPQLVIVSVMLVLGIGAHTLGIPGSTVATIAGITLHLLFKIFLKKEYVTA